MDESTDIRDYMDVILRRKWLILTILPVSVVTTLIVSLAMKPQYRATGKVELTVQSPKVTKFEDMTALGAQLQTREFMLTQLKLLRSESLADRVTDKLDLEHNLSFNPPPEPPGAVRQLISSAINGWKDFFSRLLPSTGSTDTEAEPVQDPEKRGQRRIRGQKNWS